MRRQALWAVTGVWCLGMMLMTAGLGEALSDDARSIAILAGPGLASIAATLTAGRPRLPSWVLLSGPWSDRPAAPQLLKACLPGALAAIVTAAGVYVGAGFSLLRSAAHGLDPDPSASTPPPDWLLPLLGAGAGLAANCLFVLAVVLPVGAALDARREWNTDRAEALRLLAFTVSWFGFLTIIAGVLVADPTQAEQGTDPQLGAIERKLADLRLFVNVLHGGSPQAPVSSAGAWITRVGTSLLLASLILYWRAWRNPTT